MRFIVLNILYKQIQNYNEIKHEVFYKEYLFYNMKLKKYIITKIFSLIELLKLTLKNHKINITRICCFSHRQVAIFNFLYRYRIRFYIYKSSICLFFVKRIIP